MTRICATLALFAALTTFPAQADPILKSGANRSDSGNGVVGTSVWLESPLAARPKFGFDFTEVAPRVAAQAPDAADGPGAAWASLTLQGSRVGLDEVRIDARHDVVSQESSIGAHVARTIPVGSAVSLTVGQSATAAESAQQDFSGQALTGESKLSLQLIPTGTTVSVGSTIASSDSTRRTTLSAEQTLFGAVKVSASAVENHEGGLDRALTARYRLTW